MAIKLTVVLSGSGGPLGSAEVEVDRESCGKYLEAVVQQRILAAIGTWTLRPGDTIEILGNEEAFEEL